MTGKASPVPPRQEHKRARILKGALKIFSEEGYTGASMDAIAAAAEVSKPTLYTYFGSKAQLFEAIMHDALAFMIQPFAHSTGSLVRDLHDFIWAYAEIVMKPEYLSIARLVIGEASRFPELGRVYQAAGPDKALAQMMNYLEGMRSKGLLEFNDAELAAEHLWSLILSAPRNRALHMPDHSPNGNELRRHIESGLRVFLKAYSVSPDEDIAGLTKIIRHRKSMQREQP